MIKKGHYKTKGGQHVEIVRTLNTGDYFPILGILMMPDNTQQVIMYSLSGRYLADRVHDWDIKL